MSRKFEDVCYGQRCYFAFPGICSGDISKVVPCHLRRGNVAGAGQKPSPICCMPGCFECHNAFDGRVPTHYSRAGLDSMAFVGLVQWLDYQWRQEILIPGGIEIEQLRNERDYYKLAAETNHRTLMERDV